MGLYVREAKADPIMQPGAKRVDIRMLRNVDADTFTEALVDGIAQDSGRVGCLRNLPVQYLVIACRDNEAMTEKMSRIEMSVDVFDGAVSAKRL
jgi:hypothetical protein